jgi:hypothetical protein
MARWCYDPVQTYLTGKVRFRMPYPQPNWQEERRWNAFLLEAMTTAVEADRVFSKDGATWGDEENKFYRWMLEGIADGN